MEMSDIEPTFKKLIENTLTEYNFDRLSFDDATKLIIEGQKELLCEFFVYFRENGERNIGMSIEEFVDGFMAQKNKGD